MPRVNRVIKGNIERAFKARGLREKQQALVNFTRGFNMGSDVMRLRIQNATAGMEYGYEYTVESEGKADDGGSSVGSSFVVPVVPNAPTAEPAPDSIICA